MSYKGQILLEAGTNELEVVEFQLMELQPDGTEKPQYYGINVAKIKEVVALPEVTKFPNSPSGVSGAINLRGTVISLVNLCSCLGMTPAPLRKARVIVAEFNGLMLGFIVHAVQRIHRISWKQVQPPPAELSHLRGQSVTAVIKFEDRMILMLDIESIASDINPEASMQEFTPSAPKGFDRAGKRVLIAEDSAAIRNILSKVLTEAGYLVTSALNGEEALNRLMNTKDDARLRPDLVISDIEMPKMDGLHLLSQIKSHGDLKRIPVLMFSSLGNEDNRRKALKLGAHELITKPDIVRLVNLADEAVMASAHGA